MDLQSELTRLREQVRGKLPQDVNDSNDRLLKELINKKQRVFGPKEGDSLNKFSENFNFVLPDGFGQYFDFAEVLKEGPVVLSFYRGGWCPFCNLELKFLQSESNAFKKAGGQLIAISPEMPDNTPATVESNNLNFMVLSDIGSAVAKSLGISYYVPDYLLEAYAGIDINLKKINGTQKVELPIPATFVIDQNLVVRYAFASEDFTKRAKITRILEALDKIKRESLNRNN